MASFFCTHVVYASFVASGSRNRNPHALHWYRCIRRPPERVLVPALTQSAPHFGHCMRSIWSGEEIYLSLSLSPRVRHRAPGRSLGGEPICMCSKNRSGGDSKFRLEIPCIRPLSLRAAPCVLHLQNTFAGHPPLWKCGSVSGGTPLSPVSGSLLHLSEYLYIISYRPYNNPFS